MSDERDTQPGGSPVEETEATPTEVQAAVSRATDPVTPVLVAPPEAPGQAPTDVSVGFPPSEDQSDTVGVDPLPSAAEAVPGTAHPAADAPLLVRDPGSAEYPSATDTETASQIFAAAAASSAARSVSQAATPDAAASPHTLGSAGLAERLEADAQQQQLAAAGASVLTPARDGEIRISADHPMATLYMQSPMPPDPRGNRGAGFWITLLATFVFALLFAGGIALVLAPVFPPSTYLSEGLLPELLSLTYLAPVAVFFVISVLVVLVSGRSGWWAYILGSLVIGAATGLTAAVSEMFVAAQNLQRMMSDLTTLQLSLGVVVIGFLVGILAREVSMWFGAWIGARGRKVTRQNAEAMAEYEAALADVQNSQVTLPEPA